MTTQAVLRIGSYGS